MKKEKNIMKTLVIIVIIVIIGIASYFYTENNKADKNIIEAMEVTEQSNIMPTIRVLNDDGTTTNMEFIPEISELTKIDGKNISIKDFITIRDALAPATGVCIALKAKDSFYYEINGVLINGYFDDCYITREQLMSGDISFATNVNGSLKYYDRQAKFDQKSYYTIEVLKDKYNTIMGIAATYYDTEKNKTQYDASIDYFEDGHVYQVRHIRGIVTAADLNKISVLFRTKDMDDGIYWNYGAALDISKVIGKTSDAREADLFQVWLPIVKNEKKLTGEVKVFMATPKELITSINSYGLGTLIQSDSAINLRLRKMYEPHSNKVTALVFTQE